MPSQKTRNLPKNSGATTVRLALAQVNCTVGDLQGNCRIVREQVAKARAKGADIICFPELTLTGYPPEDLLLKESFVLDNLAALKKIAAEIKDIIAVVGFVDKKGKALYNAAAIIAGGAVRGVCHKILLPNYGVFDEKRYFTAGSAPGVFCAGSVVFGVNICEDIWSLQGPLAAQSHKGCTLILNINASPYHLGKASQRFGVISRQAKRNKVCVAYANLVGGQDELVFDGQSMVVDVSGKLLARAEAFKEDLLITDVRVPASLPSALRRACKVAGALRANTRDAIVCTRAPELTPSAEVYQALVLGLHDYVRKNNFSKAVIGMSGGIDSALVAAIAVDALGRENVTGVFMPSRYSSLGSLRDAKAVVENLGMCWKEIPIEQIFGAYSDSLQQHFAGTDANIAEENLQARIRGNLLMALSNKFGWLVLTTGNKSEMSTGYATLYGDMAGGFAVIKDVPKMLVYELSRYRNSLAALPVIPDSILLKAPTAELKPDQKDSDTLPEYSELDPILRAYVEEDKDLRTIVSEGFEKGTVAAVIGMVDKSEYKRRQSPPGIKITPKAFGKDRRMPLTNHYRND